MSSKSTTPAILTLQRADLLAIIDRAHERAMAYRTPNGMMGVVWQWEAAELATIPELWGHIVSRIGGHYYSRPRPVFANGIRGLVMDGWNKEPDAHWQWSHCPEVCYDGLRREVCGDLLYSLLQVARTGHGDAYCTPILTHFGVAVQS